MNETLQKHVVATEDLHFLAYVQYMAQTARSEAAKLIFDSFVKQERARLEQSGGFRTLYAQMAQNAPPSCITVTRNKGAA